ncbi:MAG TPA: hypothetical protein VJZ91_08315 [Blastocatellia bacterium]|nr:hypothetical protein [Blastocatellia bacterium]
MQLGIVTACAIALSFLVPPAAQDNRKPQDDQGRPAAREPKLVDPGFEAFKLARGPIFGWYSDDVFYPNDPRFADVTMTPDAEVKAEGLYSLRIEQNRPRPNGRGQAFLSQTLRMPKRGAGPRHFDLAAQMRGELSGRVTIDVYVWEPGNIARPIAQRDVKVDREWKTTTVSFNVPEGYDQFGVWFYLPREGEAQLWLDDIRLTPRGK